MESTPRDRLAGHGAGGGESEWRAERGAIEAVLHADEPASADALAALALLAALRADLDRAERRLLDLARDRGASWREVAAALGLRSRQAAEQRWLRLRASANRDPAAERKRRQCQRIIDADVPAVAALRRRAAMLHDRLARLPDGADRPSAVARLARDTLREAEQAPPGAMYDLVRMAVADLHSIPARALGAAVAEALERVSERLTPP